LLYIVIPPWCIVIPPWCIVIYGIYCYSSMVYFYLCYILLFLHGVL
jgi:hypothetical protein